MIKCHTADSMYIKMIEAGVILILSLYFTIRRHSIPIAASCCSMTEVHIGYCHISNFGALYRPVIEVLGHFLLFFHIALFYCDICCFFFHFSDFLIYLLICLYTFYVSYLIPCY